MSKRSRTERAAMFAALVLGLFVTLGTVAHVQTATVYYVRAGATGSGSGTDWTNAYPALPSTLQRGATYFVADGTYAGYSFDTPASGSTLIWIKKATASDHGTSTGWSSAYGDGQAVFTGEMTFTTSYWVFDGQTGGGPGSWESGFGFRVKRSGGGDTKCFRFTSVSNVTVQHVDAENSGEDISGNADNFYLSNADYITVRNVWTHNTNRTNFLLDAGSTNLLLEYSLISERHSTDGTHGEHMSINNSGTSAKTVIRYNLFRNSTNTGTIVIKDSIQAGFDIYGNVFYTTNRSRYYNTNGIITDTTGDSTTNVKVYNNTFMPIPNGTGTADVPTVSWDVSTGNIFQNNVVFNTGGIQNASHSYNLYATSTLAGETGGQYWSSGASALFVNPGSYDYRLRTSTAAGVSLSSPYNADMLGATRGTGGVWDRGAFEYTGSSSSTTAPAPPTSLKVIR